MKKKVLLLSLSACLFACGVAFAQEDSAADSLAARTSALETRAEKWDKVLSKLPSISGYLQLQYTYDSGDGANTFNIRRARLDIKGGIYRKWADYRLQLDFASSPKIVDAFVRITPLKGLNVQVGQFKLPFSLENVYYVPLVCNTINYPVAVQYLSGFSQYATADGKVGNKATGRDMGLQLYGSLFRIRDSHDVIEYKVGVFNGSGINVKDNNKTKDFSGIVRIRPIKNLSFFGSYYYGEFGEHYTRIEKFAVGAAFDSKYVFARGEYLRGYTGKYTDGHRYTNEGGFALLGAKFLKGTLLPVVRSEYWQADVYGAARAQWNVMAGINYRPWKYLLVQADYTYWFNSGEKHVLSLGITGIF